MKFHKYISYFFKFYILTKINLLFSFLSSLNIPHDIDLLEYNKQIKLLIPTPEGSKQAVHPDIIYDSEAKIPFILAFTPYPFSIDKYENPCLVISYDGLHFFEEQKGINPIVPPPFYDHNDDPDLYYKNGKWYILYLETLRPNAQNLVLLESFDRITWTSRIIYSANLKNPNDFFMLSPSFIAQNDTINKIFFVNRSVSPYRIEYVMQTSGENFDFYKRYPVSIDLNGLVPWHIDIIYGNNSYYMLLCTVKNNRNNKEYSLYIAKSNDLISWTLSPKMVLHNSYRASGFIKNNDIFIYYSRQQGLFRPWHIGICRFKLSEFFKENL
ncbi:hypothetical protein [Gracilinema caldarium]|uniref:Glycosyl hydrolase family 32 N-terminal domain-containing protein n=1 Tax=Gracilinema caldarium (strain ATCC 51460 / DSM 7334 / H1) TaxID=744872 RepID=F8EXM6_GRAC1|nr:hypothetical protein [Gracilinema caldarium]AEJ19607.1 hypothetical protein Spica_1462 [Gracilinema caldarium DSM 7334]